jgi:hypothetical protein
MRQKLGHFWLAEFARVPKPVNGAAWEAATWTLGQRPRELGCDRVKPDEPLDPVAVRLLGAHAVVPYAHHIPHLIEKPFSLAAARRTVYTRTHALGF